MRRKAKYQADDDFSKSLLIQRLAAPIPLVVLMVSLKVLRVPKPTSLVTSALILSADTALMIS